MLPHFTATKSRPGPNLHKALLAMFLFLLFYFFLWIPYFMALSICPFFTPLCICMVHISLISILSSVLYPDVTEYIMQNTCISCRSLTPSPFQWLLWKTCVCVCVSLHARREHTGCHRANICQGDLVCQSWRMVTCVCCQGQHAAVCRDKGLWFRLPSYHTVFQTPLCIVPFFFLTS